MKTTIPRKAPPVARVTPVVEDPIIEAPILKSPGKWTTAIIAILIVGFFLYFSAPAMTERFAADEMMNLHHYWQAGAWQAIWAAVTFSQKVSRPMGALYYLAGYRLFHLNPAPFNAVRLAILLFNVFLFYQLADRITKSKPAAALASLPVAYHASLSNLAYDGAFIFDALCGTFYFAALLYYIRSRDNGQLLGWRRGCVFAALALGALDSKEMAVSLPVIIVAWEALLGTWPGALRDRIRERWGPILAVITLTAMLIASRLIGSGAMAVSGGYETSYTWSQFSAENTRYLNTIFLTSLFTFPLVVTLWTVLLYFAVRNHDGRLGLLWIWVVVTPLPIVFLTGRAGRLYIPLAGWAMVAAVLWEALARRIAREPLFRRLPARVVEACLMFAGALLHAQATNFHSQGVAEAYTLQNKLTSDVIQQFSVLPARPAHGSSVVFLNDPWPRFWDTYFIAYLTWDDPSLQISLQSKERLPQERLARMDYIFDFPDGRLKQIKP
jgi:hypothetical protein